VVIRFTTNKMLGGAIDLGVRYWLHSHCRQEGYKTICSFPTSRIGYNSDLFYEVARVLREARVKREVFEWI
jgi:hypothetical protein